MSAGSSRTREPTITDSARHLGFHDYKLLSQIITDYWKTKHKRSAFVQLPDIELEKLAEQFLLEKGPAIWDGKKIVDPVWPDRRAFMCINVTHILRRHVRNQKDKMVRKGMPPEAESDAEYNELSDAENQNRFSETFGAPQRNTSTPVRSALPQKDRIPIRDTSEAARSTNSPQVPDAASIGAVFEGQTNVVNAATSSTFSTMPPPDQQTRRDQSTSSQAPTTVEVTSETQESDGKPFEFNIGETRHEIGFQNSPDYILEVMDHLAKDQFHWTLLGRRARTDADRAAIQIRLDTLHHLIDGMNTMTRRFGNERR